MDMKHSYTHTRTGFSLLRFCDFLFLPSPSPTANGQRRVHVWADPSSKSGGSGLRGSLQDYPALPGQSHQGLALAHTFSRVDYTVYFCVICQLLQTSIKSTGWKMLHCIVMVTRPRQPVRGTHRFVLVLVTSRWRQSFLVSSQDAAGLF